MKPEDYRDKEAYLVGYLEGRKKTLEELSHKEHYMTDKKNLKGEEDKKKS